jgi:hypothetical protein
MNKRANIWLLVALLLCGTGSYAQQSAEEYNETLSNSTDSLYLMAATWIHACQDINGSNPNYGALAKPRRDMEQFLKKQVARFKKPTDVEGADEMRKNLLAFYEFELTVVKDVFVPFEELKSNASDDEVAKCREAFKTVAVKEKQYLMAYNKARQEFADKNGIDLIKKPDAPKPVYRRPGIVKKQPQAQPQAQPQPQARKGEDDDQPVPEQVTTTKKIKSSSQPAPQTQPAPDPERRDNERPTSAGNPHNKIPPKEEPSKKPKDEDEEGDD